VLKEHSIKVKQKKRKNNLAVIQNGVLNSVSRCK
jgi:hypothetical protein